MTAVQLLLPYEVQPGRLLLASGVQAGDWIFASGLLPTRFGSAARPLSGEPAWTTQFRSLWERAQAVLAAGGTDLTHTVRCEQVLPDWRAMPFFHAVRREVCGSHIPPSTSVLEAGLLVPAAAVTMHVDPKYAHRWFHETRLLWLHGCTDCALIVAHRSRSAQGRVHFITTRRITLCSTPPWSGGSPVRGRMSRLPGTLNLSLFVGGQSGQST
jgi:enamine deaminase RidA (YjgF/YER057c/UK114 family)